MFSKKTVVIAGVIVHIVINIIILSISSKGRPAPYGIGSVAISFVAPFQSVVTHSIRFVRNVWTHYFFLVFR